MTNEDRKTNGRDRNHIYDLETKVRDAVDASYLTGERRPNGSSVTIDTNDARAIRDYVRDHSMSDKYEDLIDREMVHERRHQRGRPAGVRLVMSTRHRAMIVVLHQIGRGAAYYEMPPASLFITCRDTAAEAILLGYLAGVELRKRPELLAALEALDYAGAVRS